MGKVITANVNCTNVATYLTDSHFFYKDYGSQLVINGLDLNTGDQVHFSLTEKSGNPTPMIGVNKDGEFRVDVPDNLLSDTKKKDNYKLYAFVYSTDETSGWTVHEIIIPVHMRPGGAYENPTSEEISAFNLAVEQVKASAEFVQESSEGIIADREQIQKNKEDIEKLKQSSGNNSGGEIISNVEIDATLTKSGKAADAKATGDAIKTISKEVESLNISDIYICTQDEYVNGVPTIEKLVQNTLYLVPNNEDADLYVGWMYTENGLESVGTISVKFEEFDASVKELLVSGESEWTEAEKQSVRDLFGITDLFNSIVNGNEVAY